MTFRRGDWLQTYSGVAFWPLDPRPDEIHIEDIAASLSKMCRYAGHCLRFYSVAEHSVHMSRHAPQNLKLTALLHDASEAYLVDIPRPIKPHLTNYVEIEGRLMQAVAKRFSIAWPLPVEIKRLDNAILADERDQIMRRPPRDWKLAEPPLGVTIFGWSPERAEFEFLNEFYQVQRLSLGGKQL